MLPPGDTQPPDARPPGDPRPIPRFKVDTSDLWSCDRCSSANELRVSRCQRCGAPRPTVDEEGPASWAAPGLDGILVDEAPPRGRRRRGRLAAVGAMIGLAALALAAVILVTRPPATAGGPSAAPSAAAVVPGSPSRSVTPSPTPAPSPSPTPTPSPSPSAIADLHAVGESIDVLDGLQTYSVVRVEDWTGSDPAPPGERFITALVRITAGPDQATKFDQGAFSVLDASGASRRARPSGHDPRLAYGTLEPGESTSGWVTFLVADRAPFTLAYDMPVGQNGQVETTYVRLDPIPTPTPRPTPKPSPAATPTLTTSTDNFGFGPAFTSTYYAGYGAQRPNATVSHVEGGWAQPKVSCAGSARSDLAVWVGIDDNGRRYLEQIGTAAHCPAGGGAAVYYAWYEMFPSPVVPVPVPVNPGDRFSAAVTKRGTTWTLEIRNRTTGDRFTIDRKRNAKGLQALWIVEAPSTQASEAGQHVLPLARFGRATLTAAAATVDGVRGDIDDPRWAHYRFVMRTRGGSLKAAVGDLTRGGSSFSVTWRHR